MCNLSQGVMQIGIEKGIERGIQKGHTEGILASIRSLMDSMGWTMEQAMSALKISDEDRPKYTKLLQKA